MRQLKQVPQGAVRSLSYANNRSLLSSFYCFFFTFKFYIMIGLGTLILEMGALSRLTGDPRFESAASRALRKLWSMRSSLNLLGTTLDVETGEWIEYSSGIGAGIGPFRPSIRWTVGLLSRGPREYR